jgi:tRNA modification GTPase
MKTKREETIAAIATPLGEGALAIVRVSGPAAIHIADAVFRGAGTLNSAPGFTIHRGYLLGKTGERIDEVLASVFRGPHSYTGEDAVEFSCHGGVFVTHSVLSTLLDAGARQAEPGEFTKRAFLNRRLDLSQAEAVADLIASRSHRAREASLAQLEGKLGARVGEIRKTLLDLCSMLEIDLDFSEEGIEIAAMEEVHGRLRSAREMLEELAGSYERGRVLREGLSVAIVGKPNVGKSSLFNALLEEGRAIVTHIPGTTRDFLEENLILGGVLVRVTDTAGLRASTDPAENEGVRRTRNIIRRSDLLLVVVDRASGEEPRDVLQEIADEYSGQRVILALNKIDLLPPRDWPVRPFSDGPFSGVEIGISATSGLGIAELRREIASLSAAGSGDEGSSMFVTNRRHWEELKKASASIESAIEASEIGSTNEFLAFDVREAAESLAEITGEITSEELLDHIFSRFCIGK